MIKAILFDLDNTLVDFWEIKRRSCEAGISAMIDHGLPLDKEEALKILYQLYKKHGIEYKEIFQKFLKAILNRVDYRLLSVGIAAYRKEQMRFMKPYPGVHETLKILKERNLKLGVVSDAPKLKAWTRLAESGLIDYFEFVITAEDVGEKKPHRLPFTVAAERLGVKPEQVLFIGDMPERDIKGANEVGMITALSFYGIAAPTRQRYRRELETGEFEHPERPHFILREFRDILNIIDKFTNKKT